MPLQLHGNVRAEMLDPRAVLLVVHVAMVDAADQRGALVAEWIEGRQQERGRNQERSEKEPAAIGRMAKHLFVEQRSKDVPAHLCFCRVGGVFGTHHEEWWA